MLFLLTGKAQAGKTRWLEQLISQLACAGIPSYGVLAPGIWARSSGPHADPNGFEKLGISSLLLPDGVRFPLAQRRDLAQRNGSFAEQSQSARAQLGWQISDVSLTRSNGHFRSLGADLAPDAPPGLLVVDELGRLEMQHGGGLTEAVAMLEQGPRSAWPHAVAIVRRSLAGEAALRFGKAWQGAVLIGPDDEGRQAILHAIGL